MQVFRNSAKPVLVLLAVTTFVWLVVDLSGITSQGSVLSARAAGKVNGTSIDARQYELEVQQAMQQAQRQGGSLGLEGVAQVRDQVWDGIVQRVVLNDEYEKRGITASDDEVIDALRNSPPNEFLQLNEFKTDGKFDLAKYQRWLTSATAKGVVEGLAGDYREQLRRLKLARQVTADVFVSDAALWEQYRDEHEQVKVGLTAILPTAVVPDSTVRVLPTEVEAYFKAHQADFTAKRTAFLSYVMLPRLTDASDTALALARVKAIKDELAKGAPFADVAKRESSDSASAARGGDLGEWTKGSFDPAFEKVAWSIPLNTVSEPVLTPFGYHLIEVTSRTADKAKGRHILIPVEIAGTHRDQVDARADSLDRLAAEQTDPAAFDNAARALKATIEKAAPVVEGGRVMAGPIAVPDVAVWAFKAKAGQISQVFEQPFAVFLFRLDSLTGSDKVTLATVRPQVEQAVRAEKKKAAVDQIANAYLARIVSGQSLKDAATAAKLPFREFGPFTRLNPPITDPIVVGAAFGLQPGQTSGLVKTKDGGVYVLESIERTPADSAAFVKELPSLRPNVLRQRQQERVQNYVASLRNAAKVDDRRKQLEAQAQRTAS